MGSSWKGGFVLEVACFERGSNLRPFQDKHVSFRRKKHVSLTKKSLSFWFTHFSLSCVLVCYSWLIIRMFMRRDEEVERIKRFSLIKSAWVKVRPNALSRTRHSWL